MSFALLCFALLCFVRVSELEEGRRPVHARNAVKIMARQSTVAVGARFPIPRNASN
jgi:hypothetical protein